MWQSSLKEDVLDFDAGHEAVVVRVRLKNTKKLCYFYNKLIASLTLNGTIFLEQLCGKQSRKFIGV